MNYKIELANIEDIASIHKLIYDRCLWFHEKGLIGWNINYYPKKYNQDYFKNQMQKNKLFVVKNEDEICGVMLLKEKDSDYWNDNELSYYIHHLATSIHSSGVGTLLIDYAKEQCRKDEKKYLRLDCYRNSKFLNDYYQKLGFKNVGSGEFENYSYNLWEMRI